jgi:chromosome segregation ATPase
MQDASVQVVEDELVDMTLLDRLRSCEALAEELRLQLEEKTAEMQDLQEELEALVEELRLQLDEKTAQIKDLQEELAEKMEVEIPVDDDPAVLKKKVSPLFLLFAAMPTLDRALQLSLRERFRPSSR